MANIKNLHDLREAKGFRQKYIAEKLGISRQSLRSKEKREVPVTTSEAYMLSQLYGESIEVIESLCMQR